jgi:hypothetical protein
MQATEVRSRAVRARPSLRVVMVAAGALLACDDNQSSDPTPELADPAGVWEYVAGDLPLLTESLPAGLDLRYFEFRADRTGSLHALMNGSGGGAWCQDLIYSRTFDAGLILQVYDDAGHVQLKLLVGYALDADTLRLGDGRGHTLVFAARSNVPAELDCAPLRVLSRHELGNYPALGTGLAYDGTSLIYTRENPETLLDRVDPETGELEPPLNLPFPFTLVQATDGGGSLWTVCRCSPAIAVRRDQGGEELDRVDTQSFPTPISIRALAHDESGDILWLHGLDATGPSRLLRVDSDADPNVLIRSVNLDLYLEAMTWNGGGLWAVDATSGRQAVLEIDPLAARVLRTFRSPDPDLALSAIGAVGSRLFILARDRSSTAVFLLEIAP